MAKKRSSTKKPAAPLGPETRVLILCGPEEMLKREKLRELRLAINKSCDDDIDPVMLDGARAEPADVFDELRTMSLLQSYQLVVVDDGDQFVKNYRDMVERYAENPAEGATLVLRSTNWNSPKLDKLVAKVGAKVKCDPLKPYEAATWLTARAKSEHNRKLNKAQAEMLVGRLGSSLMKLDTELAKLAVLVGEGDTITEDMIVQLVGRGSEEQAWVVQEAVLQGLLAHADRRGPSQSSASNAGSSEGGSNQGGAVEMVHELVDLSGQPEVLVLYFVADLVRKLHHAAMMRHNRVADGQITKELKLWGPRRDMFFNVLRRLDSRATGRMLKQIVRLDRRSKSGFGTAMRNLECFCAVLADEIS